MVERGRASWRPEPSSYPVGLKAATGYHKHPALKHMRSWTPQKDLHHKSRLNSHRRPENGDRQRQPYLWSHKVSPQQSLKTQWKVLLQQARPKGRLDGEYQLPNVYTTNGLASHKTSPKNVAFPSQGGLRMQKASDVGRGWQGGKSRGEFAKDAPHSARPHG